jgi:hypothetical protein
VFTTTNFLLAKLINLVDFYSFGGSMSLVYMFEASVVKISGDRYVIYPPKDYQLKLKKFHGKKVKVLVVIESD